MTVPALAIARRRPILQEMLATTAITDYDDCAFWTHQYEAAKARSESRRVSSLWSVLVAVDRRIAAYRERLDELPPSSTQPMAGISLRHSPLEIAMEQLASFIELRERIVYECDLAGLPARSFDPPR